MIRSCYIVFFLFFLQWPTNELKAQSSHEYYKYYLPYYSDSSSLLLAQNYYVLNSMDDSLFISNLINQLGKDFYKRDNETNYSDLLNKLWKNCHDTIDFFERNNRPSFILLTNHYDLMIGDIWNIDNLKLEPLSCINLILDEIDSVLLKNNVHLQTNGKNDTLSIRSLDKSNAPLIFDDLKGDQRAFAYTLWFYVLLTFNDTATIQKHIEHFEEILVEDQYITNESKVTWYLFLSKILNSLNEDENVFTAFLALCKAQEFAISVNSN